jgi:hypothetical protein
MNHLTTPFLTSGVLAAGIGAHVGQLGLVGSGVLLITAGLTTMLATRPATAGQDR